MNSKEKIISMALVDSEISHDEFTLVLNEEQNYFLLKESNRATDKQLDDIEKYAFMKHSNRIGIGKINRMRVKV